jgi:aminoglycoside phosphotransferase (APT) family kinase protein
LLHYLADRAGSASLHYLHELVPVSDGWETYIYHFQLQGADGLPREFRGPLTLRLFAGRRGIPQGRHAAEVQRYLHGLGYPVPLPVCWEESCDMLGGPFLVMEQIPGPTLLQRLLCRPWTVLAVGSRMAEVQTWLHHLPTDGFPHPGQPLLERGLDEIQGVIRQYGLGSLRPGLAWLRAHRPIPPAAAAIVHLDFHPLNLIHRKGQLPAVLDWDLADVGDPHADVATTIMFIRCAPNERQTLWERTIIATGRQILEWSYLHACRKRMVLDDQRLAYYLAWALLRRLARCGRILCAGPQVTGAKPSYTRHLHRGHLRPLCENFRRLTGVLLWLKEDTWAARAA